MPSWSTIVPEQPHHHGYDLRRTPPDKPIRAIITSDDLIGCYTHFWTGRTVPCEAPDCPACNAQSPARWHCYIAALESGTRDHFIFECTAKAAQPLLSWREAHGTLHGCFFTAHRPKRRRNARVEIICKPIDLTKVNLPKAPDLIKAMSVIWRLPATALTTPTGEHNSQLVSVVKETADAMRVCPADGPPPDTA